MRTGDPLTGLFNRRFLDETLPRELARTDRDGIPITLMIIDLDNLKDINDIYGHAVGDQIITNLGQLLNSRSRRSDISCRIGGDEIIVMLDAKLQDGAHLAETWQDLFAGSGVAVNGELVVRILSMGIVEWSPGETPEDLYARVDWVLYAAKNSGRNQIATQEDLAV